MIVARHIRNNPTKVRHVTLSPSSIPLSFPTYENDAQLRAQSACKSVISLWNKSQERCGLWTFCQLPTILSLFMEGIASGAG
jgi:hypothetical protein